MEGLERLESEVLEIDNSNVIPIFEYLKTRKDLYDKFNNKEKSIKQMWDFICGKAKKKMLHGVAMIADNLVYAWAVMYFIKSNEELGIKEQKVMPPTPAEIIKGNEEKAKQQENKSKKPEDNQINLFEEVQK